MKEYQIAGSRVVLLVDQMLSSSYMGQKGEFYQGVDYWSRYDIQKLYIERNHFYYDIDMQDRGRKWDFA
jgi:hypothetical protein